VEIQVSTSSPDITKDFYEFTVAGGTGSQVLTPGMANEILQIIIIPPSNGSTYKFYIQESVDGLKVFDRPVGVDDIRGTYNELIVPNLPLWGNNTVVLTDATNGTYKLRLVYR